MKNPTQTSPPAPNAKSGQCGVDVANQVLQSFAPDTRIERRRGGWYVCWTRRNGEELSRRWMTRGQDFYPVWHREWAHGGTASTALSQLIRWMQGKPVLPLSTWKYWAGDTCKLLRHHPQDAIRLLLDAGYPEHSKCVLCGVSPIERFDWWSLDGVSGPCCSYTTGCRQKPKESA